MKVLFVYKYLTLGGVEAVLRTRLEQLDLWGIEAHAWFLEEHGGREMFRGLEERFHLGTIHDCVALMRRGDFDLVSSIDTEEIFPFFSPESRNLPPLVVEAHSAYPPTLGYLHGLGKLRPLAVFVPSRHHGGLVRRLIGSEIDIRVIPNPVHPDFLRQPDGSGGFPVRPVLAWIGRLDEFKNWPDFLEIAGSLLRKGFEIEAWIVGRPVGSNGAEELIREARRAGVLDRLRWYRGLPHSSMPSFFDNVYTSGGAVVTTSHGESFGLTIAEAMARRCAVVVPADGPFREFVEHEQSGLYYDFGSIESATEQCTTFLFNARLRKACGEMARSVIVSGYSPDRVIGLLASELTRVAGSASRPLESRLSVSR